MIIWGLELEVFIALCVTWGVIFILICLLIYFFVIIYKLKKGLKNIAAGKDNDSFDEESIVNQPYTAASYTEPPYIEPQYHQNPYNPLENFTIKRAKLMQSLRNKISNSPRSPEKVISNDYIQPISDLNSHFTEDDYPHPKNGTLKNEILNARSRMSKKPQAPREWLAPNDNQPHHSRDRRSVTELPRTPSSRGSELIPPKDYPGFPGSRPSNAGQQFNRKPYAPSNNYGPPKKGPNSLGKLESDVMAEYDQTIANEERGYNKPYQQNPGFLHSNRRH